VPEAVVYYKKAKTNRTVSYLLMAGSLTALTIDGINQRNYRGGPQKNRAVIKIAGAGLSLSAIIFILLAKKNFKKAVDVRNEYYHY
jgi:CO dehydrogenase/acetyl-CoA synthase gamma subunit (corrinoid Fe-S protein)